MRLTDLPAGPAREAARAKLKGLAAITTASSPFIRPAEPIALTLVVPGAPRTKKNGQRVMWRMIDGVNTRFMVPSAAAEDYAARVHQAFAALPLAARRGCPNPRDVLVHVRALFFVDVAGELGDLHGYEQSLADALQHAGALEDDWSIRSWDGTRVVLGDPTPRTELCITSL